MWLILLVVVLAAGCRSGSDGAIRFGVPTAVTTLDPRLATDALSSRINRLLYRQLVGFDEAGRAVPSLARWEQPAPGRYRFTLLAEGRSFHDGSRLTALDVKATYDSVLDPVTASPHRASVAMIERVEVVDDERVDFVLTHPDPLFPAYLVIGILPAHLVAAGHPFHDRPVGSGPFRFVAWPEEGRLQLERRRDRERFELVRVQDPSVRVLKLLRGEIDLLQNDLPPELVGWLGGQPEIRIERVAGTNFSYLGFNLEDPATGRLEVRRAIAHAIDREAIIRYMLQGGARTAEALFPPDHWAGAQGLQGHGHDPQRARELLATAGFGPHNPLRLVYKTSSDPFRIRLATVIQHQLKEVGIEVELRSYDWGTFFGDIKAGRFQLYSLAWVGIETPDLFRYIFHSGSIPPVGANRGRFADPEVDRLIEQAEGEPLGSREGVYRALQQRLLEQLPYVPLWYEEHLAASGPRVQGYRLARDGNYDGLEALGRNDSAGSGMPLRLD